MSEIPTLAEYVADDWAPRFRKLKATTQVTTKYALDKWLIPQWGETTLDQISRRDIYRWFDRLSDRTPANANRMLAVLQGILSHAVQREVIEKNPARGIRNNKIQHRTRFLSLDELQRVHRALDSYPARGYTGRQQVDIIRLLILTGMRCSEVSQMRWMEVIYSVRDGLPDRLQLVDSKTGPRALPISGPAAVILHRQPSRGRSPWVFPNRRVDSPDPRSKHIGIWWVRIRKDADVTDVRLHDLRHTFASHAAMRGVPMAVLARLLGHTTERVTARYAHISEKAARDATDLMGGVLTPSLIPDDRRTSIASFLRPGA